MPPPPADDVTAESTENEQSEQVPKETVETGGDAQDNLAAEWESMVEGEEKANRCRIP